MLGIADTEENISGLAAAHALAPFARHPNRLAGADPDGNPHMINLRLLPAGAGIHPPH
jgi:hypothetical protein